MAVRLEVASRMVCNRDWAWGSIQWAESGRRCCPFLTLHQTDACTLPNGTFCAGQRSIRQGTGMPPPTCPPRFVGLFSLLPVLFIFRDCGKTQRNVVVDRHALSIPLCRDPIASLGAPWQAGRQAPMLTANFQSCRQAGKLQVGSITSSPRCSLAPSVVIHTTGFYCLRS